MPLPTRLFPHNQCFAGQLRSALPSSLQLMSYHVVALTLAQVRQGALGFQRQLGASVREASGVKVYSASPFDLDARRRFRERFGGDVVYFFNPAAWQECLRLGIRLESAGEISEEELPRRRTVVVGLPE
jgi:hypothetical protein